MTSFGTVTWKTTSKIRNCINGKKNEEIEERRKSSECQDNMNDRSKTDGDVSRPN